MGGIDVGNCVGIIVGGMAVCIGWIEFLSAPCEPNRSPMMNKNTIKAPNPIPTIFR